MYNSLQGNFITRWFFSAVVLALLQKIPCLELTTIEPWKDGHMEELCDANATMLLQLSLALGAGSESAQSTCFSKGVDVCSDECFDDSAVCKQFNKFTGQELSLNLGYDPDSRTLCITGFEGETRAQSTVQMITDAVHSLDKDCKSLSSFKNKVIYIHDVSNCTHDMAYSAYAWRSGCKTKLIPDFAFYKWPEAGLLPDYKRLTPLLASLGSHPATERRCGWAGNMGTNDQRIRFASFFSDSPLFDIVTLSSHSGPGGQGGRISMEDQVTQWACFVELAGMGYSGRVPYLLHSGRPILMVEPGAWCPECAEGAPGPLVPVWYSHLLKPWVHYIPVLQDMSDLPEKAEFALGITPGSNATKIAAAAKKFALTHLNYDAAIDYLAASLLELQ